MASLSDASNSVASQPSPIPHLSSSDDSLQQLPVSPPTLTSHRPIQRRRLSGSSSSSPLPANNGYRLPPAPTSSSSSRPPAPSFLQASQPDIIRAAQKDSYYLSFLGENVMDTISRIFGTSSALKWQKEIMMAAEFLFYGLQTLPGTQTLGEEYTDIVQVKIEPKLIHSQPSASSSSLPLPPLSSVAVSSNSSSKMPATKLMPRPASSMERLSLVALQVLAPYLASIVAKRLSQYTTSLLFASAEEDMQHAEAQQQPEIQSIAERCKSAVSKSVHKTLAWLFKAHDESGRTTRAQALIDIALRIHLTLFYLNGSYFDFAKRMTGIKYIFLRKPDGMRVSYRFLGVLMLIQLLVTGAVFSRQWLRIHNPFTSGRKLQESQQQQQQSDIGGAHIEPQKRSPASPSSSLTSACMLCATRPRNTTSRTCGHVSCWECISSWCLSKGECPYCRQSLSLQNLVYLYNYQS